MKLTIPGTKCCYQCPVTHLYLHMPFCGLLHMCRSTIITAVDIMYQCVLTLSLKWDHLDLDY